MTNGNSFGDGDNDGQTSTALLTRQQQAVAVISMYVGYASFMVLRMIPTVAGTSITSDPEFGVSTEDWGRILAMGTIGAVVGKFIGGVAADRLGGRLTFTIGLIVSSLGVAAFAASKTVAAFQITFFVALMAKSVGWPSMTKIIELSFRPAEYGRVWGLLATSSRVGTLVATFVLGGLLGRMTWQSMSWLAAGAGVLIAIGFFLTQSAGRKVNQSTGGPEAAGGGQGDAPDTTNPYAETTGQGVSEGSVGDKTGGSQHPLQNTTLLQAIGYFCCHRQFWLITFSLMGLTIMWDFLLMVPLYLVQTMGLTPAAASQTASAFPLGSLISVLVGGVVFDTLSRRATAWLMGFLLAVAAGCVFTFYLMPGLGLSADGLVTLSVGLLFVFGMCVSPCYYIPMSVFSIEFGGRHSGFLIALLDALAFGVTAIFYYFAGTIAEHSWEMFLQVLFAVCVWAMVTTLWFMLGEAKRADERQLA